MTKSITLNKYNDPGHGWYALPIGLITKLKLDLSMYSKVTCNRKGTVLFFEEDCEFKPIIEQLQKNNIKINIKEFHCNKQSKVRNFPVVERDYLYRFKNIIVPA